MPATPVPPRRKATKSRPTRPVPEVLLDLAYHLHATRAVGCRPAVKGR